MLKRKHRLSPLRVGVFYASSQPPNAPYHGKDCLLPWNEHFPAVERTLPCGGKKSFHLWNEYSPPWDKQFQTLDQHKNGSPQYEIPRQSFKKRSCYL